MEKYSGTTPASHSQGAMKNEGEGDNGQRDTLFYLMTEQLQSWGWINKEKE